MIAFDLQIFDMLSWLLKDLAHPSSPSFSIVAWSDLSLFPPAPPLVVFYPGPSSLPAGSASDRALASNSYSQNAIVWLLDYSAIDAAQ